MSEAKYSSLLDAFCQLCEGVDPTAVHDTGAIFVDGIHFTLMHLGEADPETLYVICELGPLGKADEKTCHRQLLEINFSMAYQAGPHLALDPDSGTPVMISRFPLDALTPESLLDGLGATAKMAQRWQSGEGFQEVETALKQNAVKIDWSQE
ncbi:MAG TPA: CesT family type III secretion system chaperone [Burkholderiales bacterium]|nr:CesT family type III secretion system chaperone [Burkholderiales bacterium]